MLKNILSTIVVCGLAIGLFAGCASKPQPKKDPKEKQMYQEFKADQADKALDKELNK